MFVTGNLLACSMPMSEEGFTKNPKNVEFLSIVSIDFTTEQPTTFLNRGFLMNIDVVANVNPHIPHPRWSQATEPMPGTNQRLPAQVFNGSEPWVASLYGESINGKTPSSHTIIRPC